jgi:uncharacterized protein
MSAGPLAPHAEGALLAVRVHAAGRRNAIDGVRAGCLHVSVTQAPEKGKANQAVISLVAKELGLRKSQLEIVAGHTAPQKRILIRGVIAAELAERLAAFE